MAAHALTICAVILAAIVTACVPPPALSQNAVSSAPAPLGVGGTEICAMPPIIGEVSSSFVPAMQTGAPPVSTPAIPPNMVADIYAAYSIAPDSFKRQLCGLAGIYITSGPESWGYRDTHAPTNRYIALSTNLWPAAGHGAERLNDYETTTLNNLLPELRADPAPARYQQARYNAALPWAGDGPMTVLAAMAHELGHLLWLDFFVPVPNENVTDPDQDPDFRRFCKDVFPRRSWGAVPLAQRWQRFGEINDYPLEFPDGGSFRTGPDDPPPADAKIKKLKDQAKLAQSTGIAKDYNKARKVMARILSDARPWPSLFGAHSVNEQFVETFTLYTLLRANPGLTSLALSIPNGNPNVQDIPASLRNRVRLTRMLDCFVPYYGPYPVP